MSVLLVQPDTADIVPQIRHAVKIPPVPVAVPKPSFAAQFVSLGNGCPAKDHRHAYPAVQRDKASAEHGFHTRQYGILIVGKRNKIFLRPQSDIRQGYGQSKSGNTCNAERNGAYVD